MKQNRAERLKLFFFYVEYSEKFLNFFLLVKICFKHHRIRAHFKKKILTFPIPNLSINHFREPNDILSIHEKKIHFSLTKISHIHLYIYILVPTFPTFLHTYLSFSILFFFFLNLNVIFVAP